MKFGSWTEDLSRIDLRIVGDQANKSAYWESGEWEILEQGLWNNFSNNLCYSMLQSDLAYIFLFFSSDSIPLSDSYGYRHARKYNCCEKVFPDIVYDLRSDTMINFCEVKW